MVRYMTVIGTRPEIIKLSRVIAELQKHTDHVLVHTGQNFDYELNEIFFKEMGVKKPDHFLDVVGATTAETSPTSRRTDSAARRLSSPTRMACLPARMSATIGSSTIGSSASKDLSTSRT